MHASLTYTHIYIYIYMTMIECMALFYSAACADIFIIFFLLKSCL